MWWKKKKPATTRFQKYNASATHKQCEALCKILNISINKNVNNQTANLPSVCIFCMHNMINSDWNNWELLDEFNAKKNHNLHIDSDVVCNVCVKKRSYVIVAGKLL